MGLRTLQAMQKIHLTISAVLYNFLTKPSDMFTSPQSEKQLDHFILLNRNLTLKLRYENRGFGLYMKIIGF